MSACLDIAIIGGGPAGFSAAINAVTRNKEILLLSNKYTSSNLYKAEKMDNVLGFPAISGKEYLEKCLEHVKSRGITITEGRVLSIMPAGDTFFISCGADVYEAKTIILSSGMVSNATFPGEKELLGKGVSYCATCDGMLYRKKKVALIAKNEESVNESNYLKEIGCDLVVISDGRDLNGLSKDIPVIKGKRYKIKGTDRVESLEVDGEDIECAGVFVLRPTIGMASLVPGLELNNNHIKVNRDMSTSIKGIWAAGDCTGRPYQVSKAVGEGLVAALSAAEYIDNLGK